MPDVTWADDRAAARYKKAPGYWSNVRGPLREMHRQVGDLRNGPCGLAMCGLLPLVRYLVMPNHVDGAKRVLEVVARELSRETYVNVMAQYAPHLEALTNDRCE